MREVVGVFGNKKKPERTGDYIKDRLIPQIEYYGKRSRSLRREYFIISIINTVLISSVPVMTIFSEDFPVFRYVIAITSAIASVLSSVLLIRKTKDSWLEFRTTGNMLKSELEKYSHKAGEYNIPSPDRLILLVETCEAIMAKENQGWYRRMKADGGHGEYGVNGVSQETGS